ncbi:hypothetical protein B5F39_07850 [Cloacibacillus sp. An23]|nr:hypothetical protein B5F39_07850 [Cloacibacillus sp. An23]
MNLLRGGRAVYYTVSDFANMYADGVKLVAGGGGMSRPIENVGILDYELDPMLKERYMRTNFQEGQFILTSLLFAKDSPHLTTEAVKHLVSRGASGLAIRNVFRLPLPEAALRYADSKNFPVFLITSAKLYFEDIVYEARRLAERMKDVYFPQGELEAVFSGAEGGEGAARRARRINPSFGERFFAIYMHGAEYFGEQDFMEFYGRYEKSRFFSPRGRLCLYKRGAFFFCSGDECVRESAAEFPRAVDPEGTCSVGASRVHFSLREFGECAKEALYAALINGESPAPYHMYDELGIYRALFPFAERPEAAAFRDGVLDAVREYDIENGAELMPTLERFAASGCDVRETARILGIHENTARYRMERIAALTGLSFRSHDQAEQLSLAVKSALCAKLLARL